MQNIEAVIQLSMELSVKVLTEGFQSSCACGLCNLVQLGATTEENLES